MCVQCRSGGMRPFGATPSLPVFLPGRPGRKMWWPSRWLAHGRVGIPTATPTWISLSCLMPRARAAPVLDGRERSAGRSCMAASNTGATGFMAPCGRDISRSQAARKLSFRLAHQPGRALPRLIRARATWCKTPWSFCTTHWASWRHFKHGWLVSRITHQGMLDTPPRRPPRLPLQAAC